MILKAEIKYFQILLGMMISLILLFAVFAVLNINNFFDLEFFNRYIWSIYVGLGTYSLVFAIWFTRFKESRDRVHNSLPITIFNQSVTRWFFGVSPFLFTWITLEVLRFILPINFDQYINGIVAQLGMLFIFIVMFDILISYQVGFAKNRFSTQVIIGITIVILSSLIIYCVTFSIIPPFIIGGSEFYFMAWGFLLSLFDVYSFNNREIFLR